MTHAVLQMGHAGALENADRLHGPGGGADVVQEPPSAAEQDRDEMDLQLVEHPGGQRLLDRRRPVQGDVLVASRLAGPGDGDVEALGEEVEGRFPFARRPADRGG